MQDDSIPVWKAEFRGKSDPWFSFIDIWGKYVHAVGGGQTAQTGHLVEYNAYLPVCCLLLLLVVTLIILVINNKDSVNINKNKNKNKGIYPRYTGEILTILFIM